MFLLFTVLFVAAYTAWLHIRIYLQRKQIQELVDDAEDYADDCNHSFEECGDTETRCRHVLTQCEAIVQKLHQFPPPYVPTVMHPELAAAFNRPLPEDAAIHDNDSINSPAMRAERAANR